MYLNGRIFVMRYEPQCKKTCLRTCVPSIRTTWLESSLSTFWISKDATFLYEDNEDSDQTARSLISDFVWRTYQKVRFLTLVAHIVFHHTIIHNLPSRHILLPTRAVAHKP